MNDDVYNLPELLALEVVRVIFLVLISVLGILIAVAVVQRL